MKDEIQKAVQILKQGGVVALPTETVYGLGADATNTKALSKIFQIKQRPIDHPLIVLIANPHQLTDWAREIPVSAWQLAEAFWPGPLTLILKKLPHVSSLVTGNQDTVGLRIPAHPIALELLNTCQMGIAAPSANRFGRISPTTSAAVREELGEKVDFILEGEQCTVGVESTIVDLSQDQPVILRPGMITALQIETVLQQPVAIKAKNLPRVSGSHASHYAPLTRTVLVSREELNQFINRLTEPAALMYWSETLDIPASLIAYKMPANPNQYAHDLYSVLRELDKKNLQQIIIESVPEEAHWNAIRDRLQKASCV